MKWQGIRDSQTDVSPRGETTTVRLENGTLTVRGEFQRRPGIGAQIVNTGIVCAEVNGRVVFVKANGNIESEAQ